MDNLLTPEEIEKVNEQHGDIIGMVMSFQEGRISASNLMGKISERCDAFAEAYKEKIERLAEPEKLREALAEEAHERWLRWAKNITIELKILTVSHPKDCICTSCQRIIRWERDCFKPYSELTEESKEQDRNEVKEVLSLLTPYLVAPDNLEKELHDLLFIYHSNGVLQSELDCFVSLFQRYSISLIEKAKQEERNRISKFLNDGGDGMGGWCVGNASCKDTPISDVDCVKCWQEALKGDKE